MFAKVQMQKKKQADESARVYLLLSVTKDHTTCRHTRFWSTPPRQIAVIVNLKGKSCVIWGALAVTRLRVAHDGHPASVSERYPAWKSQDGDAQVRGTSFST